MQFGINLLGKKEIASKEEKEALEKVKRTLVITLLIYALLVASLIGAQFFVSREKQRLVSQGSQLEARIKTFQKVETLEVLIKDRLSKCAKIISLRTHPEVILTKIINAREEGVDISGFELTKNGEVKLSAESDNVSSLEGFTSKIKEIFYEEGYQTVLLEGVSRNKDGGYNLSLVAEK